MKKDILSEIEASLIRALACGATVEILEEIFPEHSAALLDTANNILTKTGYTNIRELEIQCETLGFIEWQTVAYIHKQEFENAANERDKLRKNELFAPVLRDKLGDGGPTERNKKRFLGELQHALDAAFTSDLAEYGLTLLVDPGTASEEDVAGFLTEFSALYRLVGGSGINFKPIFIKLMEGVL